MAELVASLRAYDSIAQPSTIVSFESYLARAIVFSSEKVPFGVAYVNQYTGEVQMINQGPTFINFMRSLHGSNLLQHVHAISPVHKAGNDKVWSTIQTWDGTIFTQSWQGLSDQLPLE